VCVEYVPSKTDILMPAKGYVVIKTIKKCQAIYFENFIYQLTDNQGNFYAVNKNFIFKKCPVSVSSKFFKTKRCMRSKRANRT